jgi:hypothetical protein
MMRAGGGVGEATTRDQILKVMQYLQWMTKQRMVLAQREVKEASNAEKDRSLGELDACQKWERSELCSRLRYYSEEPLINFKGESKHTIDSPDGDAGKRSSIFGGDLSEIPDVVHDNNWKVVADYRRALSIGLKYEDCEYYSYLPYDNRCKSFRLTP